MKAIFPILLMAGAILALAACESDVPPRSHDESAIERGIHGKGHLSQPDRSDDPLIRENTRVGY